MKRSLGLWFMVCWLLVTPGAQAGEIERIQAKGEIVVSINPGTPPFSMEAEGNLIGIDVDLARLLAEALGVKLRVVQPAAFGEQIPRLLAGETDIIVAAMTRTPERGLQVNFTDSYFEVSQAALVRRGMTAPGDESYFDLVGNKDLRIGVKQSTTLEAFARELFPPEAITAYGDHPEAIAGLLKGEVDATVHDAPFLRFWVKSHPELAGEFQPLLAPTTEETYGFAIRKGDPEFLLWLNLFIAQVRSDGTMDMLKHRYLVEVPGFQTPWVGTAAMSKGQFLYSRFLEKKEAIREHQRRDAVGRQSGAP